ncbi:hypothetical protein ACH4A8_08480 [Streptomyces vietnamensis]|uniref:allophanate hydrolase-related protein n=1 Tax=Streptomyces vietnamensis TaxID=362257 RepID=UPI0037B8434A
MRPQRRSGTRSRTDGNDGPPSGEFARAEPAAEAPTTTCVRQVDVEAGDRVVSLRQRLRPAGRRATLARGGRLVRTTATPPAHRLCAPATTPPDPAWSGPAKAVRPSRPRWGGLPAEGLGALLAAPPRPMAPGRVELADGSFAPGFRCEPEAVDGAREITTYGGGRAVLPTLSRIAAS